MASNSNPPERDWGLYGLVIAGIGLIALLISAESRTNRAEQQAEAEETRRYVAEEIAKANERAGINSIRIDHLNEQIKPPQVSPPEN